MIMIFVLPVSPYAGGDILRGDFSVHLGERQHLVTAEFDGAGFMGADVAGLRCHHALPGTEDRVDHDSVGLCTSHKKEHVRLRRTAGFADPVSRRFGKFIQAVSDGTHHVGLHQPLKDPRMRPFHIV